MLSLLHLYLSNFAQTSDSRAGGSSGWCPMVAVLVSPRSSTRPELDTYDTVYAPPATVFPHDRQFQIPTASRLTETLPQNVHE